MAKNVTILMCAAVSLVIGLWVGPVIEPVERAGVTGVAAVVICLCVLALTVRAIDND